MNSQTKRKRMSDCRYWRQFYRRFNWDAAYKNRCERLATLLRLGAPMAIIESEARMILEARYRGRWRCVWSMFTHAARAHYRERYWPAWEWIRTRIFRRPQDETLAYIERLDEEERAIEELAKQL